jgi:hypothetical protein
VKKQLFFEKALSLKINRAMKGLNVTIDIPSLWDSAQFIDPENYSQW